MPSKKLPRSFAWLMTAQFLSALADNTLLIVTIAHLHYLGAAIWWAPLLKFAFTLSYVFMAPFIGVLADSVCKRRLMGWMNGLKLVGVLLLLCGVSPLLAFALIGLGASAYAPAKYGLMTETVAPSALVAANGWVESAVVLSILLGTVLGGALISPQWLGAGTVGSVGELWPFRMGASLPALNVSFGVVLVLYLLSALCNRGIRVSGAIYPARDLAPGAMMSEFWQSNLKLWRDPTGGLSLAVTTVFWGVGAMLQFAVLHWAVQVLGLSIDKAAYLQGIVALGVVAGAVLVAQRLRLRHATRVLPVGTLMGALMAISVWLPGWAWAVPSLLLIGTLGGVLIVPMNALLQNRGYRLLSAGQSIVVQGFNENLSILLMLLLYAGLQAAQVPVQLIMVCAGLTLIAFTVLLRRGQRSSRKAFCLSDHLLLRRD